MRHPCRGRVTVAVALALALSSLALAGCDAAPPDDGRLPVVVGFYPLQFVAERVGADRVAVTDLAQPGAEPHDLELSPRQVASIADARLVVTVHGFQPALDEAAEQAGAPVLDVAGLVPLLAADPHVWLDPTRLATIGDGLARRLTELDPAGADDYARHATALRGELEALDAEFTAGLAQCQRHEIVVSHAAFGYLTQRYGLRQIPITGLSPETEPTPAHLASAAQEARRVGATTIFFETLVSPAVAEAVAREIGATTAVLDPVEGLQPGGTGDYLSVMRDNLTTLRAALGCA